MEDEWLIINNSSEEGWGVTEYQNRLTEALTSNYDNVKYTQIQAMKKIHHLPFSRTVQLYRFKPILKSEIKGKNIWLTSPNSLVDFIFKNTTGKKVITIHDTYIFDERLPIKGKLYGTLFHMKEKYRHANNWDKIVAISELTKQNLIGDLKFNPDKIEVIYPFLGGKYFESSQLKDKKEKDKIVIGWINNGSWNKVEMLRKFLDAFIRYFPDESYQRYEVHIYGKNIPIEDYLRWSSKIKYFGYLPEEKKVETYRSFDFYLHTSVREGFGLPIMYAKALQIPVLLYDGEIPDIAKRNTIVWNNSVFDDKESFMRLFETKVDLDKAYADAKQCTFSAQKEKIERILRWEL